MKKAWRWSKINKNIADHVWNQENHESQRQNKRKPKIEKHIAQGTTIPQKNFQFKYHILSRLDNPIQTCLFLLVILTFTFLLSLF